jgi:CRISPR-associated protein Cas2
MSTSDTHVFLEKDIRVTDDHQYMVLIAYDISSNKRRNRISTLLKSFGFRIQYSVFEATLSRDSLKTLREKIVNYLEEHDNLKIFCLANSSKSWEYGRSDLEKDNLIINKLIVC